MKIDRAVFSKALGLAARIVDSRPTIPSLSAVKLSFEDDLIIEAMNTSRHEAIRLTVPYTGTKHDAILTDAHRMYDIVRQLQEGEVILEVENDKICLQNRITLATVEGLFDVPVKSQDGVAIPSADFLNLINTALCGLQEESYVEALKGSVDSVQFIADDGFECFAFDGKRISRSSGVCEGKAEFSIPVGLLKQARPIISAVKSFELSEDKHHFFITAEDLSYAYRKSAKTVPNISDLWKRVDVTEFAEFDTKELLASLNLVKSLLDPLGTRGAKWEFSEDALTVKGASSYGNISETIAVKSDIRGEWAYNTDWLIQTLNQADEKVNIGIKEGRMKVESENAAFVVQALNFV